MKQASEKKKHALDEKRRAFPRKPAYIAALVVMGLVTVAFFIMLILADLLPPDLTIIISMIVIALLLLTCFMFSSRHKWKRIVGICLAIIFVGMLAFVTNFMRCTYAMFNKMGESTIIAEGPIAKGVSVTEEPFNVYITGIDQFAYEKGMDLERSDVNMIVTVNPVTRKVLLTSIPRDTYVKLHSIQEMDKLTHSGVYGVDETLNTVEDWLGVDLNYYVKMNFTGARNIMTAMNGIDVYSPVEFDSSLKNYHYNKGWNHLSGKEALYFARERKAFEGQDSIRVENQQRVMKAVIKKMTSSSTILTRYGAIMDAAGDNLTTNMSAEEMTELVKMQMTELCEWDVQTQKIEGEYDEDYVASLTQSQKFSIYRPDPASVSSCRDGISSILNPKASELEEARKNRSKSFVVNMAKSAYDRVVNGKNEEEE
ncbi:MAG: LCP family protein [Mogibacterium sp.]|nr:LCP family protein [Mogibacterium sp.]